MGRSRGTLTRKGRNGLASHALNATAPASYSTGDPREQRSTAGLAGGGGAPTTPRGGWRKLDLQLNEKGRIVDLSQGRASTWALTSGASGHPRALAAHNAKPKALALLRSSRRCSGAPGPSRWRR
jgi:hypothetical protein